MKTYYDILGVSYSANGDEIKRAYRRMAKKYHPDSNPGTDTTEQFRKVQQAYEVLSDAGQRAVYDNYQSNSSKQQQTYQEPRPEWREPRAEWRQYGSEKQYYQPPRARTEQGNSSWRFGFGGVFLIYLLFRVIITLKPDPTPQYQYMPNDKPVDTAMVNSFMRAVDKRARQEAMEKAKLEQEQPKSSDSK